MVQDVNRQPPPTSWNGYYHPDCHTHIGAGFGRTGTVKNGANDAVTDPKCLHRQTFQRLIPGDFGPAADEAVDAEVMAAGGWLAGAIYDYGGFYAAAFAAGIVFNLANLLVVGALVFRQSRAVADAPS